MQTTDKLNNYEELLGFGLPEAMRQAILTGGDSLDLDEYTQYGIEGEPYFYKDDGRWVKNSYFTTFIVQDGTLYHGYYLVDGDGDREEVTTLVEVGAPDAEEMLNKEQIEVWGTQAHYYSEVVAKASWTGNRKVKDKHIDPCGEFWISPTMKVKKMFPVNLIRLEGENWGVVGECAPEAAQYVYLGTETREFDGLVVTLCKDLDMPFDKLIDAIVAQDGIVFAVSTPDRISAYVNVETTVKNPDYRAEVMQYAQRSLDLVNGCIEKIKTR